MNKIQILRVLFGALLILFFIHGTAGAIQLRSINAATKAKTAEIEVVGNEMKIKVWAPVNRTVGAVMTNIKFIAPDGSTTSFTISGAFQDLNVARATVELTNEEVDKVK